MGFFILVARFTSLGYLSYLTHFFSTVYFDFVARFSSLGCLSSLAHSVPGVYSVPVVHFRSMVYFILMVHLDLLGVFNDSGSLVTTGFSFRFRLAQFGWVTLAIWLT